MALTILTAILFTGLVVYLVARAIAMPRAQMAERLDGIAAYGFQSAVVEESEPTAANTPLTTLARRVGSAAVQRIGFVSIDQIRRDLMAAGMYTTNPYVVLGYRLLGVVAAPLLTLLASEGLPGGQRIMFVGVAGAVGWLGPILYVRRRARERLRKIDRELPELIDLLVITVEGGLSFGQALQVAARRMHGPLADELRLSLQETQMGLGTQEALKNMLYRSETPNMRSFVRSMTQGQTLGVSIGTILRNLAGDLRKRRRASAEEQAHKAPVKILFPLVFLIFPSLFVVLVGPAAVDVMKGLGGLGS